MGSAIQRARSILSAFVQAKGGNLTTMTALMAPVGIILAAVTIDSGSLYTQRRALQSFADVAAITASNNIAKAELAVATTLTDNGAGSVRIEHDGENFTPIDGQTVAHIYLGRYSGDAAANVNDRFVPGAASPNAVRVMLKTLGQRYFAAALIPAPVISTKGTARIGAMAAFSVGSRLVALQGGLTNAILGSLIGGSISLSVMDYSSLLGADISVFDFLDQLATDANLTAGTYSDLLSTSVTLPKLIGALAKVPGIDATSKLALQKLSAAADPNKLVDLRSFLTLGEAGYAKVGNHSAAIEATANLFQMVTGAAAVANGDHQIALNLGAAVPGILSATLDLAIGEPPQQSSWFAIGDVGTIVHTAQTRALIKVQVGGPGGALGSVINLPIYVELASGDASIAAIACVDRNPKSEKVTIAAKPGVAELRISDIEATSLANFTRSPVIGPATLVSMPLVTVTGAALVTITNVNPTNVEFTRADIDNGAIKTVSTRDLTKTLTQSLLQNLVLTVKIVGVDLGLSNVLKAALTTTLAAVTPAIDQLLMGVLDALGVSVGQLDIQVTGASCAYPALVQ